MIDLSGSWESIGDELPSGIRTEIVTPKTKAFWVGDESAACLDRIRAYERSGRSDHDHLLVYDYLETLPAITILVGFYNLTRDYRDRGPLGQRRDFWEEVATAQITWKLSLEGKLQSPLLSVSPRNARVLHEIRDFLDELAAADERTSHSSVLTPDVVMLRLQSLGYRDLRDIDTNWTADL